MGLSFLGAVCTDENLRGNATLVGLGEEARYGHVRRSDMESMGFFRNLSSAIIWRPFSEDATLILFDNSYTVVALPGFGQYVLWGPDYSGRFLQITNVPESGSSLSVNRFADHGFNDQAASMIVVDSRSALRFSFRDLFLARWNQMLDAELAGSEAKRKGDPILTWEMWPLGISYLDPNRRYLKIHQRLKIELDWWPDYSASMTYHIYLYLDQQGKIRGYVARWAYWIEGGMKADDIEDKLRPKVISGATKINDQLSNQLAAYSGFSFTDLYYLPGRQTSYPSQPVGTGSTADDVTIVLELTL